MIYRYKENIIKLGKVLQDEPMSGLEKAVWWVEYVIRNKGAPYLRNPAIDIPWHEYLLLDVCLFLITVLAIVSYVIFKVVTFISKHIYRFKKTKEE